VSVAAGLETVFTGSGPVLAYPLGRHVALTAARPTVSVLVVVDGAAPALETLDLDPSPRLEVVLLDNCSPAFGECAAYVVAAPNRVLYRLRERIPRQEAWRLARSLARGSEQIDGVPETRERALLALGSEVVADPALLRHFAARHGEDDDVTLVIAADEHELALLPAAVEEAGVEGCDLVAVPAARGSGAERRLAAVCDGVLTLKR